MNRNAGLLVRVHARLHDDERGFSLIETVIAVTVIFGSLITLAMSASTGFRYVGIGREQQAANQIANQLMEQARGLAFSKIQKGLMASVLSTDPNLVTGCGTDPAGTYHLKTCAGDKVVSTNLTCPPPHTATDCSVPIVPSTGTVGETQDYPVDYTWHSYVTNNCPAVIAATVCPKILPYKVTIFVTWTGAGTSATGVQGVTTQSLFHSPAGCINSSTHPFAAPCQPFFYGQALTPAGQLQVSGTVSGVDFLRGTVLSTGVESTMQIEQVAQVQSSWTQTQTNLTSTSAGSTILPATASFGTTAADSDPSGTTPSYQVSAVDPGDGSNQFASGGGSFVQVQNASADSGQAISATAAGGSNTCPPTPPAPPAETDLQPCGGARVLQAGTSRVVGHFHGFLTDIGDATIASISNPSVASTAFTNRMLVSGQDGNIQETAMRAFGTVSIGGLPDLMPAPTGWTGYFLQLTGYADTVQSTAGTSAAAPTATINAGSLAYWNGTGYTTVNLSTTPSYSLSELVLDHTALVGLNTVEVKITAPSVAMGSVPATTTLTTGCAAVYPTCKTDAQATIGSPISGSLTYQVWVDAVKVVDLTIDLSLGTLAAKSLYGPTPTAS
jgi:type II secretory pathway pseudopilin PulG